MFSKICFIVYFISLFMFSLINNPMYYCGLLVFNSLLSGFITYNLFGFSWYTVLFCLVYIGGVYILFIFISVFSPNSNMIIDLGNIYYFILIGILFFLFGLGIFLGNFSIELEFSSFLCSNPEGNFYLWMCLVLVFGFIILSLIMNVKFNYYR